MLVNTCSDKNIFSVSLGVELGTSERGNYKDFYWLKARSPFK